MLLALVHSRFLGIIGQPVVAAVIFTGSLIVFYYTVVCSRWRCSPTSVTC